jgi:hypothetical protein
MVNGDLDPILLSAAAKADALRAAGLAALSGVTQARQAALERERGRLAQTLGADHPRVQGVVQRLEDGAARLRDLAVEIARAKTVVPPVGEAEWAVHGHVRRADRTPVPDVTVMLVDGACRWQRAMGYACSDADGNFRLASKVEPARAASTSAPLYLRVIGQDRRQLYRDENALTLTPGAVEYREIVLHDGSGRGCAPPEEDLPTRDKTPPSDDKTRTGGDKTHPPATRHRRTKGSGPLRLHRGVARALGTGERGLR